MERPTKIDLDELWALARVRSDDMYDAYAQGVYDTLQYVMGNDSTPPLSKDDEL